MRKSKIFIPFMALLFVFGFNFNAQSQWGEVKWQNYTWDEYDMQFQIPTNFTVRENSSSIFTADDGSTFTFQIVPWKDASLTANDVANLGYKKLNAVDVIIDVDHKIKLSGFSGYEIIGTGYQGESLLHFAVLGFIDKNSPVNFYAYCLFWDDKNTNNKNMDIGINIIESIGKIGY